LDCEIRGADNIFVNRAGSVALGVLARGHRSDVCRNPVVGMQEATCRSAPTLHCSYRTSTIDGAAAERIHDGNGGSRWELGMSDRRRLQAGLRTLLIAAAVIAPYVWLAQRLSLGTTALVIGLVLLAVPVLLWGAVESRRDWRARLPMAAGEAELTGRALAFGRMRHAAHPHIYVLPTMAAMVLVVSIVLVVGISLPAIKGPGFDHTAYYRECPVTMVLLPRAIPIGLVAGFIVFAVAMQLGERMGRFFASTLLGLFGAAVVVACAFLIGNGLPSSRYLDADAADVFLVSLLPIGVQVVIGAVLGGRVAEVS
jgi:hypothetical protein